MGIKDSAGDVDQLIEIRRRTPEEFGVFVGAAGAFYPGLCVGAVGAILAVANAAPELCVALHERFRSGDREGALELQQALMDITPLVTAVHDIGGLKAAMAHRGYAAGDVRSPLAMPGPAEHQEIETEIDRLEALRKGLY